MKKLMELANKDSEHIYCKHDGSLNDGFEIVSHPMTTRDAVTSCISG